MMNPPHRQSFLFRVHVCRNLRGSRIRSLTFPSPVIFGWTAAAVAAVAVFAVVAVPIFAVIFSVTVLPAVAAGQKPAQESDLADIV